MEQNAPLYAALRRHLDQNRSSFHTPGHKCRPGALPDDLLSLDLTELPDTDSLFEASGPIFKAEQHAAAVFGTAGTLLSAGGCTLCIQAMLRLVSETGRRVVITSRVLHRSAVHAMALLDLTPVWICPEPDAGAGLPGRVRPETVADALKAHPDAAAVYLTSPDYYGVLSPVKQISEICRRYDVPLLVDNAHGAHLFYTSQPHPLRQGASMTADSPHKTLPVLTGGAWLQIGDSRFLPEVKSAMALFGSTSPSYPVMASLDLCAAWLERHGKEAYARLEQRVAALKDTAHSLGYALPEGPCDPTRLTLCTSSMGIDGNELAEAFRKNHVEPEYHDSANVVLICTPFNTEEDFLRLERAIAQGTLLPKTERPLPGLALPELPPAACSLREAVFAKKERIPLSQAVGRIAAEAACPCPPGIPAVMPGETITEGAAEFLRRYGFFSVNVIK